MTETVIGKTDEAQVATVSDYINLLKPRIMMLVVFTAFVGLVAAPGDIHPFMAGMAVLAVALGSGAAGAINMWYDHDIDAVMSRTSTRPIPSGRVPRDEALAMGLILSLVAVLLMFMASNLFAAALLALSIAYYVWLYTMVLKRRTPQNIVIGGGAGAFPPVIGWAAVTGTAPLDAWLLFAIIFMWTPPHFWALSLLANKEYEKAGVPMLPVTHGAASTRAHILVYAVILALTAGLPVLTGLGGLVYGVSALLLNAVFVALSVMVFRSRAGDPDMPKADAKAARNLFAFSILYLFLLFAVLMVEHAMEWRIPLSLIGA